MGRAPCLTMNLPLLDVTNGQPKLLYGFNRIQAITYSLNELRDSLFERSFFVYEYHDFQRHTLTIIMWVDIIYSKATIHFPAHFICKSANTMENILRSFQIDKSHFRQLFRVDWMEEGNKSFINYLEQK